MIWPTIDNAMKTENFQHKMDLRINKYLLKFLPQWFTPNRLTVLRLILVPVVYYLLTRGHLISGFVVFAIAALTDALDGARARTEHEITDFGKLMDPIADKLLIGSVFLYFGLEYVIVKIFLIVIGLEIIAVITSALAQRAVGRPMGANVYGKIKMVLQTLAVTTFLLGLICDLETLIVISEWVLFVALFFALISGLEQMRLKIEKLGAKRV